MTGDPDFLTVEDVIDSDAQLSDAMIAIAERRLDKAGLATLLRQLSRPVPR